MGKTLIVGIDLQSIYKILCFIFYLMTTSALATELQNLRYLTEDYPPANFQSEEGLSGISIELITKVWELAGITSQPIELVPFARGYYDLQNHNDTVLFAVARTPDREDLFKWACPIVKTRYVLLAKKENKITVLGKEQLNDYTIGTVRSDISEQILLAMLTHSVNILSNVTMKPNIELLDKKRIQMIAYDELAISGMLVEFGRNPNDYEIVFTLGESVTCFAFNKNTNDKVVTQFQQLLEMLTSSEDYPRLVAKYYRKLKTN